MVNIAAGVAEATTEMTIVRVSTAIVRAILSVLPRYSRPVFRFISQGRTSLSAVSPDYTLIGGKTAAA